MPTTSHQSPATARSGFTVIELTVVLAVIAALMGSLIMLASAALENRSYNATADKLKTLQQALVDYRLAYNRLPCPAKSSVAVTVSGASAFGKEAATTGYCMGGTPTADAGQGTANAAFGMVPVRTLGLPDEMAVDGWGRRIRYAVSTAFVTTDAFDGVAATDTTTRLTINNNDTGLTMTTGAVFVLMSAGADGHGAYSGSLNSGTATTVSGGITNANTLINCKCNSSGVYNSAYDSTSTLATFVQGEPKPDYSSALNNFDDIVVFSTRADLRNPSKE